VALRPPPAAERERVPAVERGAEPPPRTFHCLAGSSHKAMGMERRAPPFASLRAGHGHRPRLLASGGDGGGGGGASQLYPLAGPLPLAPRSSSSSLLWLDGWTDPGPPQKRPSTRPPAKAGTKATTGLAGGAQSSAPAVPSCLPQASQPLSGAGRPYHICV
jgi:hypothetical protein